MDEKLSAKPREDRVTLGEPVKNDAGAARLADAATGLQSLFHGMGRGALAAAAAQVLNDTAAAPPSA